MTESERSENSPFAAAILENLLKPSMTFQRLATAVTQSVREKTADLQNPWVALSLSEDAKIIPPVRKERAVRATSSRTKKKPPALSLSVPPGATFEGIAITIGRFLKRVVALEGFTPEERKVPLRAQEFHCDDPMQALQLLGSLATERRMRKYEVVEDGQRFILRAEKAE
jgi:hypothetical protein